MDFFEDRLTFWGTERSSSSGDVLYWMQASVRVDDNLALAWAAQQASAQGVGLAVFFVVDTSFPEANARSFAFLLEGLDEVQEALHQRGLSLVVVQAEAVNAALKASQKARFVVLDRGYTQVVRSWHRDFARQSTVPLIAVEDNVSVPVRTVSDHEEWAARTLRPKLQKNLLSRNEETDQSISFPRLPRDAGPELASFLKEQGLNVLEPPFRPKLAAWSLDTSVPPVGLRGGPLKAQKVWQEFLNNKLARYGSRNDPLEDVQSGLSPYLHFGHLTPLTLIRDLKVAGLWRPRADFISAGTDSVAEFLDEVLVRRELSVNFVYFQPRYDAFDALPTWALKTLTQHEKDPREFHYTEEEWETGQTHDEVWNACQKLLTFTGTMPGYLRMYWGKKILEWSSSPRQAFSLALKLNNKWALDGRDPNSWAGVAWCFGKHDRPWGERAVWGSVRSMVSQGLRRKFDVEAWLKRTALTLRNKA
jgi:deoxyribodipyrimidine photo-lyase